MKWVHVEAPDPYTGESVPLFNPRVDVWTEHFRWNQDDPAKLDCLSSIARSTAELLELNADYRIQIRHWLAEIGKHPPIESNSK